MSDDRDIFSLRKDLAAAKNSDKLLAPASPNFLDSSGFEPEASRVQGGRSIALKARREP